MSDDASGAPAAEVDYMHRLAGEPYQLFLRHLHATLRPQTYLEIGTQTGGSLKLAECRSIAIDVNFKLNLPEAVGRKPICHFFQMTSDAFFRDHDPAALLGGPIDLAFLDGLHLFEFLLRDFANVERYCRPNSVVLLHDCLPPAIGTTTRKMNSPVQKAGLYPNFWAGDVWKVIPILREYRPDLRIFPFNATPTGIVAVTNLAPGNTDIAKNYFEIVRRYSGPELDAKGFDAFWSSIELIPTRVAATRPDLASYFWL
jgi:hypothetical protein